MHEADLLVGDHLYPTNVQGPKAPEAQALIRTLLYRKKAALRSLDWVVQSLVHGRLLDAGSHARFALEWRPGAVGGGNGIECTRQRYFFLRAQGNRRYEQGDFVKVAAAGGKEEAAAGAASAAASNEAPLFARIEGVHAADGSVHVRFLRSAAPKSPFMLLPDDEGGGAAAAAARVPASRLRERFVLLEIKDYNRHVCYCLKDGLVYFTPAPLGVSSN